MWLEQLIEDLIQNRITELSLIGYELDNQSARKLGDALSQNTSLKIFRLGCLLSLEQIRILFLAIRNHVSIEYLDLSYSALDDALFCHLLEQLQEGSHKITHINLTGNLVSSKVYENLFQFIKLRQRSLFPICEFNVQENLGIEQYQKNINECIQPFQLLDEIRSNSVKELTLNAKYLEISYFSKLLSALSVNTSITIIYCQNRLIGENLRNFLSVLSNNPSLIYIDFPNRMWQRNYNDMVFYVNWIRTKASIRFVNLGNYKINEATFLNVFAMFHDHPTLEVLLANLLVDELYNRLVKLMNQRLTEKNKLTIELVPKTCWFKNVRSEIDHSDWDRIREEEYRRADYHCEICGGIGTEHPVECHEKWFYDDEQLIQRLEGFFVLCPSCHTVKHRGLANIRGLGEQADTHLSTVNKWPMSITEKYVDLCFKQWSQRSKHEWKLDISYLTEHSIIPKQSERQPVAQVAQRRKFIPEPPGKARIVEEVDQSQEGSSTRDIAVDNTSIIDSVSNSSFSSGEYRTPARLDVISLQRSLSDRTVDVLPLPVTRHQEVSVERYRTPKPSTEIDRYWVFALHRGYQVSNLDESKIGKWMLFYERQQIDEVWDKIQEGIDNEELWYAKVSGAGRRNDPGKHAIMVYTPNYEDITDVIRVHDYLESQGLKNGVLYYKTDTQTRVGIYAGGKEKPWIYNSDILPQLRNRGAALR